MKIILTAWQAEAMEARLRLLLLPIPPEQQPQRVSDPEDSNYGQWLWPPVEEDPARVPWLEEPLPCPFGNVGGTLFLNHPEPWRPLYKATITSTAQKRLVSLTEEDAIAAGAAPDWPCSGGSPLPSNPMLRTNGWGTVMPSALANLKKYWQQDHPDDSWDTSWVWAIGVEP